MIEGATRAFRFWRAWANSGRHVRSLEIEFRRESETLPATLYLPSDDHAGLPGWVLLHGITVPGRRHEALVRFANRTEVSFQ